MLNADELERVCMVLVRARNPGNIGAVARAMHDFGFRRLRVVNEFPVPFEAARSAVDASAVLADATVCASVAEAVADCTLVVGTTAVGERELRHRLLSVTDAAQEMRAELAKNGDARVAILFGSEKTGLSNEELSHCHWLLTIPMSAQTRRHLSMNLGQAAAVCLYELGRNLEYPSAPPLFCKQAPAFAHRPSVAEIERLTTLLCEVLEQSEYKRHHPANSDLAQVRRLVMRMGIDAGDAQVWMGVLRQVLWKLSRPSQ
jgi:TrmH family RNA methyltransferase